MDLNVKTAIIGSVHRLFYSFATLDDCTDDEADEFFDWEFELKFVPDFEAIENFWRIRFGKNWKLNTRPTTRGTPDWLK